MDLEKALEIYRTCELPNSDEEPDKWLDYVDNVCPQCVLSREVEVDHEVKERMCILLLEIEESLDSKIEQLLGMDKALWLRYMGEE